MTDVDDAAEEIVLSTQEYQRTVHFAHLTSMFLRTLEADGVDHIAAIALTQHWMVGQSVEEDDE